MKRQNKKTRLVQYMRDKGFHVVFTHETVSCRRGNDKVNFKRKTLQKKHYEKVKLDLSDLRIDVSDFDEQFLAPSPLKIRRQIPIGLMELQYDMKPNGVVIRLNSSQGCLLRICKVPVELVFDSQGNPKDFVDIEFSRKPERKPIAYFRLKKFGKHQITGKGTVFTVHRDENDVEGISVGDVVLPDNEMEGIYEVTGTESFKNNFGKTGKNIALLVKEIKI